MTLTVRSSNALMRAGATTFGKLWEIMNQEQGLSAIRNLGIKSVSEIEHCFFASCYALLSQKEKAIFWQSQIDGA